MWPAGSGERSNATRSGGTFHLHPLAACPKRTRRLCFRGWMLVSFVWVAALLLFVGARIDEQVKASRELARDIARLDCPVQRASCAGKPMMRETWLDVADVVWTFGGRYVLALLLAPPAALLVVGVAALRVRHGRPSTLRERS